jgi:dihydrofolate reductase
MVDRVLLTRITNEVECDTFLDDFTSRMSSLGHGSQDKMWRLAEHRELEQYVGFEVKEGEVEEKEFKYRFEMWVLA